MPQSVIKLNFRATKPSTISVKFAKENTDNNDNTQIISLYCWDIGDVNLSKLKEKENVIFILDTNIIDIIGDEKLESVVVKENSTNKESTLNIDGLFIAIGHIPVSSMCDNIIDTDEKGYIISNEDCTTNIDGIFAAGDVRVKDVRQLTTATSDGTISAINACKYIESKLKKG